MIPTPAAAALEAQIYPSAARIVDAVQRMFEKADAGCTVGTTYDIGTEIGVITP